jgi:hypothetical protein
VSIYRLRFEGSRSLAVRVATELADADGVELLSSGSPTIVGDETIALELMVEGTDAAVADAVAAVRDRIPEGSSIAIVDD